MSSFEGDLTTALPSPRTSVILIAGPPAVGKGTQCELLIANYGLVHISPGQILRDHVKRGTQYGKVAAGFMDAGQLVPGDVVINVVKERMAKEDVANRGCLLDNFPLTTEQAEAMKGHIDPDVFFLIEAPAIVLAERAQGRLLDPVTGSIYHSVNAPPSRQIVSRLERRSDDSEDLIATRVSTYEKHIHSILPYFEKVLCRIDGTRKPEDVFSSLTAILDAHHRWGPTLDLPYCGSKAFGGCFSAKDAKVAGFYSPLDPPSVGTNVVCFARGPLWQKQGQVMDVSNEISDGSLGLKPGVEGDMVTVIREVGSPLTRSNFRVWSVFLAPLNDMEYSSVCTTAKFQASRFCRLHGVFDSAQVGDASPVPLALARESLIDWLTNLQDADGEDIEVTQQTLDHIVSLFDSQECPSLHLYTTNVKLCPRTSITLGSDFSVYYRALNNVLNNDNEEKLTRAMPLIMHMVYDILYTSSGEKRWHRGGNVWKGDAQRPVPLNMQKLKEAAALGSVIRFRQFQSTTSDEKVATKYLKREDSRGFLWSISIPKDFWGARDIIDIAWRKGEAETLFPPYAAFHVTSVDADSCHLVATEFTEELDRRPNRHGLRGTAVELLDY